MRVGVVVQPQEPDAVEFAQAAEAIGVDSLWAPEIWGYDALTGLSYLAARTTRIGLGTFVVQLGSRTPAMLAGSALSLQQLSGGRFTLGIGVSGPAVMEGWHGVPFGKPVQRTRETIDIVRMVMRGERLRYDGQEYRLPLPDSRGAALVPALLPAELPIYVAAMGPANLRLTGELADGWLGNAFIPELSDVVLGPLAEGAARAGRNLDALDLVAPVALEVTDDPARTEALIAEHAAGYAFTIGAMGAGKENFYNRAFARLGFADRIDEVARLWQAGDKAAARAAVPLELGGLTNIIGDPDRIAERVRAYREVGVGTLLAKVSGTVDERIDALAVLVKAARA
ncbi:FMN-dependent monooxygenase [Tsukamurella pulmonis]|uniref:LLM class flavin-dependent oxidoreductase n=1 Tax=Tsukamurella pulmonis TaxID=47312 RepID=UPI0007998502|nr:LLM class flavin-dependent oxidoreductase [Tsukamurella pulmonis]KXP09935.1 F420-dependent methylene-tetrahydromethanopterin reductase [Tsukamurella pulmonis]RDH11515.1 LLM class flavin-dependent oxidoreductase [Tsukamurella pulmonis]BDD83303.1 FMN-dependent monooxygenase [Tsukamurella pulmonis]